MNDFPIDKKKNPEQNDIEILNFGPLRIERRGRFIRMSSHWDEKDHQEFLKKIAKEQPTLKSRIDREIQELRSLLTQHDSLELLSPVTTYNLINNQDTDSYGNFKGQPLIEFALNLALSDEYPEKPKKLTSSITQQVIDSARNIIRDVWTYFGFEFAEKKREQIEEKLRYLSILRHLVVRGKAYQDHYLDTTRELFQPLNDFFKKHWGYEVIDFINVVKEVFQQISNNLNSHAEAYRCQAKDLHDLFIKFTSDKDLNRLKNFNNFREQFNELPEVKKSRVKFLELEDIRDSA
ncbi:MAG: hypothetical protein MUP17_07890 [candidate division Zixibacteria bacterium]|nr:hypothetical protein [candidate division Zixibacteria bacterium]